MPENDRLSQPVSLLSGIGKQTALRLNKLNIYKVRDLLFHLPIRYEDRTQYQAIASLNIGQAHLFHGCVEFTDLSQGRRRSLICRIGDGTGYIDLRFFHFSAKQQHQLEPGTILSCYGEVRQGYAGYEVIHPEYKLIASLQTPPPDTHLTPVYPLTEGLRQSTLRKAVNQAITLYQAEPTQLPDLLPAEVLKHFSFPALPDALQQLHSAAPGISHDALSNGSLPALQRFILEEFCAHHLSLTQNKKQQQTWQAPIFQNNDELLAGFIRQLPFSPTQAQLKVMHEVSQDCGQTEPMMRLIQGDVGSGKTVVCAYAALLAAQSGFQTAVMAPTELLAEQHYQNFQGWFDTNDFTIALLTANIKGKARQQLLEQLETGNINILIGTHALFQNAVMFRQLGLIVIDEQHRFGVHQRMALRDKGRTQQLSPHQLVMTATPIPRTLAMLNYSDLDISVIDELPPGRKAIVTSVIPADKRQKVIDRISHWVEQNRQAYWVCTLIEESELLQCEAAEQTAQSLSEQLPDCRIALVHGRMKSQQKDDIMQAFKQQRIDLLVATTVIEVGVDVPNAGLMIIENPERLGLSQLHQLRGRVGRGPGESFCVLMYQPPLSDLSRERLGIIRETNNGFEIAEKDLQLRGPGEVLGTRQTGQIRFKIADLARDGDLLEQVQFTVSLIQKHHPGEESALIDRWIDTPADYTEV